MRLVSFRKNNEIGLAVEVAGELRGRLASVAEHSVDIGVVLSLGGEALQSVGRSLLNAPAIDPADICFLPPLTTPPKIICVGLNYADHTKESPYEQPDYPTLFPRFSSSLIGHGQAIVRPSMSDSLDFEGELVAVIGKGGRHISRARALEHVAGYSIFNDASVREYQFKSPQWTVGKNFDATGAFGPYFVTADEVPRGGKGLRLETRLNGNVVQSASTDDMLFDLVELISVVSEAITLLPGDVIVTGTPAGIGWARTPRLLMRSGDICEVEIEGLGILRNPIVDETASAPVPS
ncbi:fumarylacetoacetate hydrolase family protein [Ensifer adhaerens]|uniref:fumarylacetoacetate hydrolase family protein n=1 Tax=Ensifer adhaerens TaxID=106592 RepID=UPI000FDAF444|nr:fumarylacetoacetate hydrolase family protein [Ensifer adhaerens]MDF8357655.1 fumarylacetoacetate hydrolase family protein [Ensifer adhaerens]THA60199.1 FAA hydrolase family protein [Ensifer adhaerens]